MIKQKSISIRSGRTRIAPETRHIFLSNINLTQTVIFNTRNKPYINRVSTVHINKILSNEVLNLLSLLLLLMLYYYYWIDKQQQQKPQKNPHKRLKFKLFDINHYYFFV